VLIWKHTEQNVCQQLLGGIAIHHEKP